MILSSAKVLAEMLHTQNIPKFRIIDVPFPTGWFLHRKIEGFRGSEHQPIGFFGHAPSHLHRRKVGTLYFLAPEATLGFHRWAPVGRQWHGGVARDLRPKFALVRNGAGHLSIV